ncbi:protease complex subunit PrcB family protein [Chitinophaga varians]|uniref:protease complex subunit PrcB family protein n=1 Tax=Chitinophaga varians TaxID=2202339 RepID=UPI00165ED89F|nr:protease complex subunit PrcB family protein [Chitinophaga varians]MBC9909064.1 protease complex subunit PrcB family protein [Chitinophaga varians]
MNRRTVIALPLVCLTLHSSLASRAANVYPATATVTAAMHMADQAKAAKVITYGQGVDLIVKALGLNIDNIRFIKEPKATDYCEFADNKASYAQSVIIAANNGITLDRKQRFNTPMTREQFALALEEAIEHTGPYPMNMMWINIGDAAAFVNKDKANNAVQALVKFGVVALERGNFRPKANVTPAEANAMVAKAAKFVKEHKERMEEHQQQGQVTVTSTPVNAQVNSVVLSRGSQPNSGYQIAITGIDFAEGTATVRYKLTNPEPGKMYMQMITEPKAETFVGSAYKVVLQQDK